LGRQLFGVDLSSKMLEKASQRGLYDGLACTDIVECLRSIPPGLSLVASSDVFIYIGDLEPVFAATAAALQPGGIFAFSIEDGGALVDAPADPPDYVLGPTRRFAHSQGYLDRLSAQHGFEQLIVERVALRQELLADVAGIVLVLRRPAA
jgi:predicted TPR repeat methyltransferase